MPVHRSRVDSVSTGVHNRVGSTYTVDRYRIVPGADVAAADRIPEAAVRTDDGIHTGTDELRVVVAVAVAVVVVDVVVDVAKEEGSVGTRCGSNVMVPPVLLPVAHSMADHVALVAAAAAADDDDDGRPGHDLRPDSIDDTEMILLVHVRR